MKGTTIALISTALFSLYAIFGKLLLEGIDPVVILVAVQTLAGVIIVLALDILKKIRELKETTLRDYGIIFVIAIFTSVLAPVLFLEGLRMTSVANSILIAKSEIVLTSLLAVLFLRDRITMPQLSGAFLMFTGVLFIATQNLTVGLSLNPGDLLVLLSAASYAVGTIFFKRYMRHLPPEVIVASRNFFGALMLLVIALFVTDLTSIQSLLTIEMLIPMAGLVLLSTIAAQMLWYRALEMTTASKVAMAALASPLFGVFYAVVLLGEPLLRHHIVGGALIIGGLVVMEVHFNRFHAPARIKRRLKFRHMHHA